MEQNYNLKNRININNTKYNNNMKNDSNNNNIEKLKYNNTGILDRDIALSTDLTTNSIAKYFFNNDNEVINNTIINNNKHIPNNQSNNSKININSIRNNNSQHKDIGFNKISKTKINYSQDKPIQLVHKDNNTNNSNSSKIRNKTKMILDNAASKYLNNTNIDIYSNTNTNNNNNNNSLRENKLLNSSQNSRNYNNFNQFNLNPNHQDRNTGIVDKQQNKTMNYDVINGYMFISKKNDTNVNNVVNINTSNDFSNNTNNRKTMLNESIKFNSYRNNSHLNNDINKRNNAGITGIASKVTQSSRNNNMNNNLSSNISKNLRHYNTNSNLNKFSNTISTVENNGNKDYGHNHNKTSIDNGSTSNNSNTVNPDKLSFNNKFVKIDNKLAFNGLNKVNSNKEYLLRKNISNYDTNNNPSYNSYKNHSYISGESNLQLEHKNNNMINSNNPNKVNYTNLNFYDHINKNRMSNNNYSGNNINDFKNDIPITPNNKSIINKHSDINNNTSIIDDKGSKTNSKNSYSVIKTPSVSMQSRNKINMVNNNSINNYNNSFINKTMGVVSSSRTDYTSLNKLRQLNSLSKENKKSILNNENISKSGNNISNKSSITPKQNFSKINYSLKSNNNSNTNTIVNNSFRQGRNYFSNINKNLYMTNINNTNTNTINNTINYNTISNSNLMINKASNRSHLDNSHILKSNIINNTQSIIDYSKSNTNISRTPTKINGNKGNSIDNNNNNNNSIINSNSNTIMKILSNNDIRKENIKASEKKDEAINVVNKTNKTNEYGEYNNKKLLNKEDNSEVSDEDTSKYKYYNLPLSRNQEKVVHKMNTYSNSNSNIINNANMNQGTINNKDIIDRSSIRSNSISNSNSNKANIAIKSNNYDNSKINIQPNKAQNTNAQSKNLNNVNKSNSNNSNTKPPLTLSNLNHNFQNYDNTKCSIKSIGSLKAYAANTYQGIVRNYNEDRVSIILNISKPGDFVGYWPKCSIFGIYDGHGGSSCADFLRDNLHSYVIKDSNFPQDPKLAIKNGFHEAEQYYINILSYNKEKKEVIDKSGSCALFCLIIDGVCFLGNVGDSRAVLSVNQGNKFEEVTKDHKPNEDGESKRIINNGGRIYQTQTVSLFNNSNNVILGPHRVFPGRLSVSRTFGDVEAKETDLGGIPGVVIAEPEITSFEINNNCDFLVLGCDGIFDQLSNKEIIDAIWLTINSARAKSIHFQCAVAVDMIIKSSMIRKTFDNVTLVVIAFNGLEGLFNNNNYNREPVTILSSTVTNDKNAEQNITNYTATINKEVQNVQEDRFYPISLSSKTISNQKSPSSLQKQIINKNNTSNNNRNSTSQNMDNNQFYIDNIKKPIIMNSKISNSHLMLNKELKNTNKADIKPKPQFTTPHYKRNSQMKVNLLNYKNTNDVNSHLFEMNSNKNNYNGNHNNTNFIHSVKNSIHSKSEINNKLFNNN